MKRALFPLLLSAAAAAFAAEPARDAIFATAIDEMFPRLVETRRDMHRHPELSNEETRTVALVAERLRALGLEVTTGIAAMAAAVCDFLDAAH